MKVSSGWYLGMPLSVLRVMDGTEIDHPIPNGEFPFPESYVSCRPSSNPSRLGEVAIGTVREAVPVERFVENFSPRPLIVPPPFGELTEGRKVPGPVVAAGVFAGPGEFSPPPESRADGVETARSKPWYRGSCAVGVGSREGRLGRLSGTGGQYFRYDLLSLKNNKSWSAGGSQCNALSHLPKSAAYLSACAQHRRRHCHIFLTYRFISLLRGKGVFTQFCQPS
jgi:hypothetical protein